MTVDTTVRFVGPSYQLTLNNGASELMRQPGGGGWGMAPVANSWFEGAGDGAQLRGTRRLRRQLTVPVAAFGTDRAGVEAQLRRLGRTIHDPFRVYVDFPDGRSFWIDAVYEDGAAGAYTLAPDQYAEMPIVLSCPDPYWTSDDGQSFTIAPAPADAPFLPRLTELNVASSAALGTATVINAGDVSSRPTWTIQGPGDNPLIALGAQGFQIIKTIPSNETVTVRYEQGAWTVKNQAGANLYGYLAAAPWFVEFPPGTSVVTAQMANTGAGSFIRATYPERREIVYGG